VAQWLTNSTRNNEVALVCVGVWVRVLVCVIDFVRVGVRVLVLVCEGVGD